MGAPDLIVPGTASGTAPVGGSGTTNTIPRWTGATTLGDSGLIDNGTAIYTTTRNVGIGTATPGFPLDVTGNSRIGTHLLACTDFGEATIVHASVSAANRATRYALTTNATGNDTVINSGNTLNFRILNVERARIDSAGNVSIGYTGGSWSSTYTGMFLNRGLSFMARDGGDAYLSANAIYDSSNAWRYVASGSTASTQISLQSGATVFSRAVAGTAGSALTWLESARIDSSGNFGIGTASPVSRTDIAGASVDQLAWGVLSVRSSDAQGADKGGSLAFGGLYDATNSTHWAQISGRKENGTSGQYGGYLAFATRTNGAGANTERARIDSSGNFGIGTGAATTTPAATGSLVIGQNNVSQQWAARIYGGNDANRAPVLSLFRAGNTEGIIAEIKNGAVGALALGITGGVANFNDATLSAACQVQITSTLLDISGLNYGLKLPNAPGNTDPNTLDSYREGTRVLAAGDLSGWTYVTATQYWTLVGRTVTLHTIFTGGTSSATGGATIATPPLLTPLRIAAGAAVNSSGTALGNGVCVVASTSSTTGTVTTSSAISSSALDKVITVTYETAGL